MESILQHHPKSLFLDVSIMTYLQPSIQSDLVFTHDQHNCKNILTKNTRSLERDGVPDEMEAWGRVPAINLFTDTQE